MKNRIPESPLKETLKRSAGQSGQEQLEKLYEDKVMLYAMVAAVPIGFAAFEWIAYLLNLPRQPIVITVFAVAAAAWGFRKLYLLKPLLKQIELGRDGERQVAQQLAELLPEFKAFHDIPCAGFNIDHALIGSAGVFSIETKTRSKWGGANETVNYDGEQVLVNGHAPDRDPIVQAKAGAKTLSQIIFDQSGKRVWVTPVVLFPGWFVVQTVKSPEVMVLNPKMLPGAVRRTAQRLSAEDVTAIAAGMLRHQEHMAKVG